MSIVEFLRARYAEQRTLALAATPGPWEAKTHRNRHTGEPWGFEVLPIADLGPIGEAGVPTEADAQHVAAHGPDAVLADLDAKLAVVEEYDRSKGDADGATPNEHTGWADALGWVMTALALPFAAHPDYDERWRP